MKVKLSSWWFGLGMIGIILGGWFLMRTSAQANWINATTPTIFVHGWGSSAKAEHYMTQGAVQAGVTKTVVQAQVDRHGQVTFNHPIPKGARNPIVEVNLADNKLTAFQRQQDGGVSAYHRGGWYILQVVRALERQHHYAWINFVGHSMGNLEIINYLNDNSTNHSLPRVRHLVAIAGHYNGLAMQDAAVDAAGKPDWMAPSYQALLPLRQKFDRQTAVLNLYGDLQDGSHSDGDVGINSAQSLKYLVGSRAKSYQEVKFIGRQAQHSRLHHNRQVNRQLIKFLWGK